LYCAAAKLTVPLADTRRVVTGASSSGGSGSWVCAGAVFATASLNRSMGGIRPIDWCGRSWLYSRTHRSSRAWASSIDAKTLPSRNSRRSVLCQRSTLPVVVGDRGAVRM
jgi:hypothetical protein